MVERVVEAHGCGGSIPSESTNTLVAQLDRASGYEPEDAGSNPDEGAKQEKLMKALLLALLLVTNPVLADNAAMAVTMRGDVFVNNMTIERGALVYEGDTVYTLGRSFVVLQFTDGSKVTVRPDSQLVLDKYRSNKVQLDLVSGGLRVVTGAIAKSNPENYKVSTKTALMGVRGTEFSVQIVE